MRWVPVVFAFVSVVQVAAEKFTVLVGENNLAYSPETVTAKTGDVVAFRFKSGNHTVTQSTFVAPCEAMTTPTPGIDSDFLPVPAGATEFPEWSFTVDDDTTPFWFYCAQATHCAKGMVFAVNPTPEKTFEAFKAVASGGSATTSTSPEPSTTSKDATQPTSPNGARGVGGSSVIFWLTFGPFIGLII